MSSAKPTRTQADLADVLELLLDKGIVINADITITVGETELLGIELRAAIASFETAAEYGLAFPSGTDMRRVEQASGREPLDEEGGVDLGIGASTGGEHLIQTHEPPGERPDPTIPFDQGESEDEERAEGDRNADDTNTASDSDDEEEADEQSGETGESHDSESEES